MSKTDETFESLWKYCTDNNRVCPLPDKWNELFNTLRDNGQVDLPLILNGWEMSSPIEKQLRFEQHIRWAAEKEQLLEVSSLVREIEEKDWLYFN